MSRSYLAMGRRRIESSLLMKRIRTLSPVEFDTVPVGNDTEFALELGCAWLCIVFYIVSLSRKFNEFGFWLPNLRSSCNRLEFRCRQLSLKRLTVKAAVIFLSMRNLEAGGS